VNLAQGVYAIEPIVGLGELIDVTVKAAYDRVKTGIIRC
jgi:hypothetical protein